jgi:3-oxoacyl-[acyl-carrier-protein] synthase II
MGCHLTDPYLSFKGTGVRLCIEKALASSGVRAEDVNYINAHATSTKAGDLQEYKALMRVFGENPEVTTKDILHTLFKRSFFWCSSPET